MQPDARGGWWPRSATHAEVLRTNQPGPGHDSDGQRELVSRDGQGAVRYFPLLFSRRGHSPTGTTSAAHQALGARRSPRKPGGHAGPPLVPCGRLRRGSLKRAGRLGACRGRSHPPHGPASRPGASVLGSRARQRRSLARTRGHWQPAAALCSVSESATGPGPTSSPGPGVRTWPARCRLRCHTGARLEGLAIDSS